MYDMSVTFETSHEERSPLKKAARKNMNDVSVTSERSGVSVALFTMFTAPSNADSIVDHFMVPHWSID